MSPEELDAIAARMGAKPKAPVLDLSGDDSDHALVDEGEVLRCRRCGAGRYLDRPGLLPKQCDQAGYRRRRMGL